MDPRDNLRASIGGVEEPAAAVVLDDDAVMLDVQVASLLEMGFDERLVRGTLMVCGGNFDEAVQMLLAGDGVPMIEPYDGPLPELPRPADEMSCVQLYGPYSAKCGYCKDPQGFHAFAFRSRRLTIDDYEALMYRNFTRSGTWTYSPLGDRSCCALYQIRLDPRQWVPSKMHRKARKKVDKYFSGPIPVPPVADVSAAAAETAEAVRLSPPPQQHQQQQSVPGPAKRQRNNDEPDALQCRLAAQMMAALERVEAGDNADGPALPTWGARPLSLMVRRPKSAAGLYASPLGAVSRALWPGGVGAPDEAVLAAAIVRHWNDAEYPARVDGSYIVFDNALGAPHPAAQPKRAPLPHAAPPVVPKQQQVHLVVALEEADFSEEKFALYRTYQQVIHNEEDTTPESFQRFVCNSPLVRRPPRDGNDHPFGFGTAHMTYRDARSGALVGVACLDLLPSSLVSVYFFFDTEVRHAAPLGTYSAIREIELMREYASMRYYFLCWYSPHCPKLDYKRRFKPSELLCPETLTWHPYEGRVRATLDEFGYARLAPPDAAVPEEPPLPDDCIFQMHCEFGQRVMPYASAREYVGDAFDARMRELARRVGVALYRTIIVQLPQQ